jgi:hypothetical protein
MLRCLLHETSPNFAISGGTAGTVLASADSEIFLVARAFPSDPALAKLIYATNHLPLETRVIFIFHVVGDVIFVIITDALLRPHDRNIGCTRIPSH